MKQSRTRAFALAALLPLTGLALAGCPKQETSSDAVPYGQQASQVATTTPAEPPAPVEAVPPGPKMAGPKMGGNPGPMADNSHGGGSDVPPVSGMSGPMMGGAGGGNPMAPLTPTPQLDKAIQAAEAKGDKKTIAAGYASRGYSRMTDDNAGQRVKYRKALEDFRVALKNDPANVKAKQNMTIIEDIYKSMGRPVPQ